MQNDVLMSSAPAIYNPRRDNKQSGMEKKNTEEGVTDSIKNKGAKNSNLLDNVVLVRNPLTLQNLSWYLFEGT